MLFPNGSYINFVMQWQLSQLPNQYKIIFFCKRRHHDYLCGLVSIKFIGDKLPIYSSTGSYAKTLSLVGSHPEFLTHKTDF